MVGRPIWRYVPARNQHLDPSRYAVPGRPCFATIRCWGTSAPFADPRFAAIAVETLRAQATACQCQIIAYCVMSNHVHILVTPSDGGSSLTFIHRFKGACSRQLGLAGWHGKVWQPRFYDRLLRTDESIANTVAYILANPVRKGLVAESEDYPWSGVPDHFETDPDRPVALARFALPTNSFPLCEPLSL